VTVAGGDRVATGARRTLALVDEAFEEKVFVRVIRVGALRDLLGRGFRQRQRPVAASLAAGLT
jgi:hypothetical protein